MRIAFFEASARKIYHAMRSKLDIQGTKRDTYIMCIYTCSYFSFLLLQKVSYVLQKEAFAFNLVLKNSRVISVFCFSLECFDLSLLYAIIR